MESATRQEQIDFFRETLEKYQPYPLEEYMSMGFDDKRFNDGKRLAASISLKALLDMGFSEDEINPWKTK